MSGDLINFRSIGQELEHTYSETTSPKANHQMQYMEQEMDGVEDEEFDREYLIKINDLIWNIHLMSFAFLITGVYIIGHTFVWSNFGLPKIGEDGY